MKKRTISLLISVMLVLNIFLGINVSAEEISQSISVKITYINDFYSSANTLSSDKISFIDSTVQLNTLENTLNIEGTIPSVKPYSLSIVRENDKITSATDKYDNYTVLSVLPIENFIRIILENNNENDMYYIEFSNEYAPDITPYNQNWYLDYLDFEITEMSIPATRSTSQPTKTYTTSTNVYGDVYKETLVIKFSNDWDNPVSSGVGFRVINKMILNEKTTKITRAGSSSTTTLDGNSLLVNSVVYKAVTPKGEYFREADTQFRGEKTNSSVIEIGMSFGIPNSPFSISFSSTDENITKTIGSSSTYFDIDDFNTTDELAMAISLDFSDPSLSLTDAANEESLPHQIVVDNSLKTHDNYIYKGSKAFTYKWNYQITSTGNCHGVGVNIVSSQQSYTGNLYYTLN